jgi:hypothetical protein
MLPPTTAHFENGNPKMSKRWTATIFYRGASGITDVDYAFEEMTDLAMIIERGPHWGTIDQILVRLARNTQPGLTLEQALEQ